MALKETIHKMHQYLNEMSKDLEKSAQGNKAASQRVRTGTIKFSKLAKQYRKESITSERKATKPSKKIVVKAKPPKKKKK